MHRIRYGLIPTILTAAIASACGPDASSSSTPTDEVGSEIIGGTNQSAGTATAQGFVYLNHTFNGQTNACSAWLLRNDVVMTARHCVTIDSTSTGLLDTTASDFTLSMDGQTVTAAEILNLSSTDDAALIVLSTWFKTGSSGSVAQNWLRNIYAGTDSALVGSTLNCYGYGANTCAQAGAGTLREANLKVSASTSTSITFQTNASGQIQWKGDSGSTCLINGLATVVMSTCGNSCGMSSQTCTGVGPQELLPNVNSYYGLNPAAQIYTATQALSTVPVNRSAGGEGYSGTGAGVPGAGVMVTQNWNPPGQGGVYNAQNVGVYYDGSLWRIFNECTSPSCGMPSGASFNVSVGNSLYIRGAISGNTMATNSRYSNQNANQIVMVTPVWNPPGSNGVYNDHPVGVYWAGSQWAVFNECPAGGCTSAYNMPSGVAFNVRIADQNDSAYVHRTTSANVSGDSTVLNNVNLGGQPGAKVFVTHNWNPGGAGGTYWPHSIGVWYDGSNWNIFNEDGTTMPAGLSFNVMVLP